ncbi:MAG: hypothetical protein LRS47_01320 [Desulfurococcales archaeon]|nr:hypothetical protein [Desulfurococcales archaeon]
MGQQRPKAGKIAQKYVREVNGSLQAPAGYIYYILQEGLPVKQRRGLHGQAPLLCEWECRSTSAGKTGREKLYSKGLGEEPATAEVHSAPSRHVDRRNEETYFH